MTYQYLVKSQRHLVQILACNLLPKGYHFYATSWIPEGKDELLIDAKLIITYQAHLPKWTASRRRKAGYASVKYLRCGRLVVLLATKGRSPFFEREAFFRPWDNPLVIGGHSITVDKMTGKVSVRLHREAQNRIKRFIVRWAGRRDRYWWERRVRAFPFLPFSGVRDNLFALVKFLNATRKAARLEPVRWDECVRKTFTPEPVFLDTPAEIKDLLKWEQGKRA